jgi:hypothetical protein
VLGPLTVSAAALVAGVLVAVDLSNSASVPVTLVLASALAVVALGLVVGSWVGRSRGLIVLGLLLAVVTAVTAALPHVDLSGGMGDRTWQITNADQAGAASPIHLGTGTATVDLSRFQPPAPPATASQTVVTAGVGLGTLRVWVPADMDLVIDARVQVGSISLPRTAGSGLVTTQGSVMTIGGRDLTRHVVVDRPHTDATLVLDLTADVGEVDVYVTAPATTGGRP